MQYFHLHTILFAIIIFAKPPSRAKFTSLSNVRDVKPNQKLITRALNASKSRYYEHQVLRKVSARRLVKRSIGCTSVLHCASIIFRVGIQPRIPMENQSTRKNNKTVDFVVRPFKNVAIRNARCKKQLIEGVCQCTISEEDIRQGIKGCGKGCLNRYSNEECNNDCPLGTHCGNKKLQNAENSKTEIFKTENKGLGLQAAEAIDSGQFIIEYGGEKIDSQEFLKRREQYSKRGLKHFYFMKISTNNIIDPTIRGNIAKFINHSCDPNTETQKLAVNDKDRIGFFAKRKISTGEEITYDYQYKRYGGQHAQKCLCQSSNCSGWLGGKPETEDESPKETDLELESKDITSLPQEHDKLETNTDSTEEHIVIGQYRIVNTKKPVYDWVYIPHISCKNCSTEDEEVVKNMIDCDSITKGKLNYDIFDRLHSLKRRKYRM